eukprot:m.87382 g.87382  ORF g.87382 m.87382 type:complete len:386 (+) comp12827_c0_seq5:189-1346(+)
MWNLPRAARAAAIAATRRVCVVPDRSGQLRWLKTWKQHHYVLARRVTPQTQTAQSQRSTSTVVSPFRHQQALPVAQSSDAGSQGAQLPVTAGSPTVFALSTGHGKAGVAVIRISGDKAFSALQALLQPCTPLPKPRMASLCKLYDPTTQHLLDFALVLCFAQPASFTGENVVELHVHGGTAVVSSVLKALGALDSLQPAEAGEFTKRAFWNNKLDLTQVEGLADLISAETEAQHKQAIRQMNGEASSLYEEWRIRLLKSIGHIEAYIDFGDDENIETDVVDVVLKQLKDLRHDIARHLNDWKSGERVRNGVTAAIIGKPDVGKSSLLNYLCRNDVANAMLHSPSHIPSLSSISQLLQLDRVQQEMSSVSMQILAGTLSCFKIRLG